MYLRSHDIHGVTKVNIGTTESREGKQKGRKYQALKITVFTGKNHQTITLYSEHETLLWLIETKQ